MNVIIRWSFIVEKRDYLIAWKIKPILVILHVSEFYKAIK